jgi:CSLREA domain-containing protein
MERKQPIRRHRTRRLPFASAIEELEQRSLLAVFIVNSPADPGTGGCDPSECTLREAILEANNLQGTDDIQFRIGTGVVRIALQSELPRITDSVNIDGRTQPGFNIFLGPIVWLDGAQAPGANGLILNTSNSSVRGLVINRFSGHGIVLQGGGGHTIAGNSVGADPRFLTVVGNGGNGILALDSTLNTIGGTGAFESNLIIGNTLNGIALQSSHENVVVANFIGTTGNLRQGLGNGSSGIALQNSSDNRIGGIGSSDRNVIQFNGADGVSISAGQQNLVLRNSIFSNGGLGIDLESDGPNFPQDADPGPGANLSQNFPVLSSATASARGTFVLGTLSSTPGSTFTVDFYASDVADASGFGEGQLFLEERTVRTNSAGLGIIDATLSASVPAGSVVSATATSSKGDTSEFSGSIAVTFRLFDLNVRGFVSASGSTPSQLELQYEVVGSAASQIEFAFFESTDPRFDGADKERGPRFLVNDPKDLTVGLHSVRLAGDPYQAALASLDVPFFVARASARDAAGNQIVEASSTNNDINFIGVFHVPGTPLVLRGKDDTDRYADKAGDTITLSGASTLTVAADFLAQPVAIASDSITEIRVLASGGDDSIVALSNVRVPLVVRGGDGDDTATGGSANDTLQGEAGDDVLGGRQGDDLMDGGAGKDTADFGVATHRVNVNLGTGRVKGQGRDSIRSIEDLTGSPGRDRLTGDAGDNVIRGGAGADIIRGGPGRDVVDGGSGDDILFGEEDADVIDGGAGNDIICGGDGNDIVTGGAGDDRLAGGGDDDELSGGDGSDFVCGDAGNDTLAGNTGADLLQGEAGIDRLLGGANFDAILFDSADQPFDLGGAGRDGGKAFRVR